MADFDRDSLPWLDRVLREIDDYLVEAEPEPVVRHELRGLLFHWMHFGYVLLPQVIEHALIDAYLADVEQLFAERKHSVLVSDDYDRYVPVREYREREYLRHGLRIIDFHNSSVAAKKLSLHPTIVRFLGHLFRDQVVLMQSLTFMKGSQQEVHQDYAYVIAEIPSHLAASWIALEDVDLAAGPLGYYPGSHTIPKFEWGDGLFRTAGSTRNESEFSRHIHERCREIGLEAQCVTPKKGDVFLWHGALAHGGAPAADPDKTRRSYVSHYSSRTGYRHDYRAKDREPDAVEINGGLVYRHPTRPEEEDVFRRGASLP